MVLGRDLSLSYNGLRKAGSTAAQYYAVDIVLMFTASVAAGWPMPARLASSVAQCKLT